MIGTQISHYRITAKLGEGGMGAVYRAEDTKLKREVALKFLPGNLAADPESRKRLVKEAQAASRLNHPNIGTVYEVHDEGDAPFIAMELVKGESLKQMLQRGSVRPEQLLEIARQIAEGLNEAHKAGVLHRDIKPANIMVDASGRVKVLDFGIATLTGRQRGMGETEENFITRTAGQASTGGTVPYMAPEQLRGEEASAASDIFSFGVLLYECLSGRLPFRGDTAIDVLHAILHETPATLRRVAPSVPPAWEQLIDRCLAKQPNQRTQSMSEVLQLLDRIDTAPAEPDEKSVAVLYFQNLSRAQEDEYFRDGITEDVITELLKIKGLRVFPRSAVVAYRDKGVTAAQVGQELSAAYVLEGSLRRAGDRLRITTQLIETRNGQGVWAERYDRQLQDVFEVQDEIARSLAQALRVKLTPQEEKAIARKPTENAQAYDCYLRGRSYTRRVTRPDLEFAIQMYERAIALDEHFALAYAGLGYVCGLYYEWHERESQWLEKGLGAAERALGLDSRLPEALAARARIYWAQKKLDQAIEFARRAIELRPDCEGAYWSLGELYFASDRWEEGAALAQRAIEVSGDDYNVYIPYTNILERVGKLEEGREIRRRQNVVLERQLDLVPEDVRARILLSANSAFFGESDKAQREAQKAVSLRPNDPNILYNAACTMGILGKKEEALGLLRKAKENGFPNPEWALRDPDLACLQGDPEFQQLMAEGQAKRQS
ncbi:MAG TPA: protein kinase [Candidatus Acidoferrales bacterium]|nr:protein kinase [Candidatus Acidoferrales bacterium]